MNMKKRHAELRIVLDYLKQEQDLLTKETADLKGLCIKAKLDDETHDTMHNLLFSGRKESFKRIMNKFDVELKQLKQDTRKTE